MVVGWGGEENGMGKQASLAAGCTSELSAIRDLDLHFEALALALCTFCVWFAGGSFAHHTTA